MRIAFKSTLIFLLLFILLILGVAFWIEGDLRRTVHGITQDTARLVGQQITLALHANIMDELLRGERGALQNLKESLSTASERSEVITSIDVIDAAGKVVASDNDSKIGQQRQPASELFAEERETRIVSNFDRRFQPGNHKVQIPLTSKGELLGYLLIALSDRPLVELYDQAYTLLILAASAGLVTLVSLGLLLEFQVHKLSKGLTMLLTETAENPNADPAPSKDDFAPVREAAGKLGLAVREAREKANLAIRDLDILSKVMQVGVVLLDADDKPVFISDAARELLADGRFEAFDQQLEELRADIDPMLAQIKSEGKIMDTLELDEEHQLQLDFYPLDQHEWRGCLIVLRDRASLEALETDLREATRFRGITRLYAGAVHDLKAPLNAMSLNLELLRHALADDADSKLVTSRSRYLGVVEQELQRLKRLLMALLEQTGPSRETRTAVDLNELFNALDILLQPQLHQQQVSLTLRLPESPAVVYGYAGQLKQVFLNIMLNALEAMSGGGELRVEVSVSGRQTKVAICDTGPGIPKALQSKIFDLHFTTRDTGTGIGLYVARVTFERHGGSIELDSELGAGSCFNITLPLADKQINPIS